MHMVTEGSKTLDSVWKTHEPTVDMQEYRFTIQCSGCGSAGDLGPVILEVLKEVSGILRARGSFLVMRRQDI